jgi:hypothetical protein
MYLNKPYYVLGYSQGTFRILDLSSNETVNVRVGDLIRHGISIPKYEATCIEKGNTRTLEVIIGSERYMINNAC